MSRTKTNFYQRGVVTSALVAGAVLMLGYGSDRADANSLNYSPAGIIADIDIAQDRENILLAKSVAPAIQQNALSALPRSMVRRIQGLLNSQGYNAGPVDGVPGDRTKSAIRRYTRDLNLPYQRGFVHDVIIQAAGGGGNNAGSKGNQGNQNSGGNNSSGSNSGGGKGSQSSGGGNAAGGGACGWYAIALCGANRQDAEQATNQYGGFVIDTSDPAYPNFRAGFYCVVEGPYAQSQAEDVRDEMRDAGSSDAYAKNAC